MMDVITTIITDATARSENIKAQENIDEACLTQPPSNLSSPTVIGAVAELTSAELTPLDMSSMILGPRSHNAATVVSTVSTNVNMDKTLTDTSYPVYVKTLTEAENVLHRFEGNTKNRYSVWRCPKDFGNSRKQCMLGIYLPHTRVKMHKLLQVCKQVVTSLFTSCQQVVFTLLVPSLS